MMLAKMGHIPLLACNGQQALDAVHKDSVDLIISDLQMPVMNGLELLKRMREHNNDIPCIIITAYGTVETAVEAMKYGALDYITRPLNVNSVTLAINRALAMRHIKQAKASRLLEVSERTLLV